MYDYVEQYGDIDFVHYRDATWSLMSFNFLAMIKVSG